MNTVPIDIKMVDSQGNTLFHYLRAKPEPNYRQEEPGSLPPIIYGESRFRYRFCESSLSKEEWDTRVQYCLQFLVR